MDMFQGKNNNYLSDLFFTMFTPTCFLQLYNGKGTH
jgi:hypothetical protein